MKPVYRSFLVKEDVEDFIDQYEERVAIVAEGNSWTQEKAELVVANSYGYLNKEAFYFDMRCQLERIEEESCDV